MLSHWILMRQYNLDIVVGAATAQLPPPGVSGWMLLPSTKTCHLTGGKIVAKPPTSVSCGGFVSRQMPTSVFFRKCQHHISLEEVLSNTNIFLSWCGGGRSLWCLDEKVSEGIYWVNGSLLVCVLRQQQESIKLCNLSWGISECDGVTVFLWTTWELSLCQRQTTLYCVNKVPLMRGVQLQTFRKITLYSSEWLSLKRLVLSQIKKWRK